MRKILAILGLCMFSAACGGPDHVAEQKAVCAHSEGTSAGECNAGDNFSPLDCEAAIAKFESWWNGSAMTAVNSCMTSSACYTVAEGIPGPSISLPLDTCMQEVLLSVLKPTDAVRSAVASICTKFGACGTLISFTVSQCEEVLLNPFDEGQSFLLMGDSLASTLSACDVNSCADYSACINAAITASGANSSMNGVTVKMPVLLSGKN